VHSSSFFLVSCQGPGRKPGTSLYTRKRLCLILSGAEAKAWSLYRTRKRLTFSHTLGAGRSTPGASAYARRRLISPRFLVAAPSLDLPRSPPPPSPAAARRRRSSAASTRTWWWQFRTCAPRTTAPVSRSGAACCPSCSTLCSARTCQLCAATVGPARYCSPHGPGRKPGPSLYTRERLSLSVPPGRYCSLATSSACVLTQATRVQNETG
jgi:hypothetical protein